MFLSDTIYGVIHITEPVISEIITCPTFQRMHGIGMGCWMPSAHFRTIYGSRYDHSIGVFLLLRKYGAPLVEQISGLIHDVSHTAFSHLSDRLFGDNASAKTSQYQDSIHDAFVKNSEIGQIITRAGFDLDEILDDARHPLKERSLPELCADRIDYCLRAINQLHQLGYLMECDARKLANSLVVTERGFAMCDIDAARTFAHAFNTCDERVWSNINNVCSEQIFAHRCRHAIDLGVLTRDDFFELGDIEIIQKMINAGIDMSQMYGNPLDLCAGANDDNCNIIYQKIRRVDPPFIDTDGNTRRLSECDEKYAEYLSTCPKFNEYAIKKSDM